MMSKELEKAFDNIVQDYEDLKIYDDVINHLRQTKQDHDNIFKALTELEELKSKACEWQNENYELKYDKERLAEELEAIKSVDYNNTIKMLKGMRLVTLDPLESTNEKEREALLYARKKADKTNSKLETAINALLKAQAQERELAELKEIISLFNKFNRGAVSKKGLNEEEYSRFKELSKKYNMYLYGVCEGSERE
jgi:alkylhydroperoxidase family enzyme